MISLLTEDQNGTGFFGDIHQLQVIKDYGTKTGLSDLAIVLGGKLGNISENDTTKYLTSDNQASGRVWLSTCASQGSVQTADYDGKMSIIGNNSRHHSARPVIHSPTHHASKMKSTRKIGGVEVVEYGEYPQTIAPEGVARELEQKFKERNLKTTFNQYTFDANYPLSSDPFKAEEYDEYEHHGKHYIRVEAYPCDSNSVLSNGHKPQNGEVCWIEVQPIEWLKDPSGLMIARQALFAGIPFQNPGHYKGDFAKTGMHHYLQDYFAREMMPQRIVAQEASTEEAVGTKHAAAALERTKDKLRPIIDAALDVIVGLDPDLREKALGAAEAKQQELSRRRGE